MPNLKAIRKRISSVKNTQKITRAMKMVAGARLNRAQQRTTALRPYAEKTQEVLASVVGDAEGEAAAKLHPLLVQRPEKTRAVLVLGGDRGLCGAYNANVHKAAERLWKEADEDGVDLKFYTVGRKPKDYLRRRSAPVAHDFEEVWSQLDMEQARLVARSLLKPYKAGELDSIIILFTRFKSAMTQEITVQKLLPVLGSDLAGGADKDEDDTTNVEFIFEPNRTALLDRLVPMYIEISILQALYESQASELGARMTAMDSATKNAKDMIGRLTLEYNRARQAAITTELMEIIGGAEALKD